MFRALKSLCSHTKHLVQFAYRSGWWPHHLYLFLWLWREGFFLVGGGWDGSGMGGTLMSQCAILLFIFLYFNNSIYITHLYFSIHSSIFIFPDCLHSVLFILYYWYSFLFYCFKFLLLLSCTVHVLLWWCNFPLVGLINDYHLILSSYQQTKGCLWFKK